MKKIIKTTFISLTFVATLLLTGCVNTSSSINNSSTSSIKEKIELKFWHGFTGADGDGMAEIIKDFNKDYAGEIEIIVDKLSWDALFLKLIQNKSNPRFSPHIVAMGDNRVSSMVARDLLRPLDNIETYLDIKETDFISAAWNVGLLNNTTRYSFPLDIHPVGIYYNKDLISEAELPTTWAEFLSIAKAKTNPTTGVYGWAVPNMYSITKDIFYSMLLQEGYDILDEANKAIFNNATAVSILEQMYAWKYSDKISPVSVGAGGDLTLFQQGKSVFYFDGPWMLNTIRKTSNIEFGVIPMPESVGAGNTSYSGSHQFTVVKSTVQDDHTLEAAYTFFDYVSKNSLQWAEAGQVPARRDIHDTNEYKALTDLMPFSEMAKYTSMGKIDYQYFYEAYNYMGSAVANTLNNVKPAQASLNEKVEQFHLFVAEQ